MTAPASAEDYGGADRSADAQRPPAVVFEEVSKFYARCSA